MALSMPFSTTIGSMKNQKPVNDVENARPTVEYRVLNLEAPTAPSCRSPLTLTSTRDRIIS